MTNHTAEPSAQIFAGDASPPVSSRTAANRSIRNASITAGVGLLLMSALAIFGNFVVLQGMVTPGDATTTAADIMASEGMFRAGVVSWFLIVVLDLVIAWALFRVFRPVSESISLLAALFRLVYTGVLMVAVGHLLGAVGLLSDQKYLAVLTEDQIHAQALQKIDAFTEIWDAGLVLFGLHLLLIGYLASRSGYVPRIIGVLLAIAGIGYVVDSFAAVLSDGSWTDVSSFTFLGEFLLALWLVIRARRLTVSAPRLQEDPTVVAR